MSKIMVVCLAGFGLCLTIFLTGAVVMSLVHLEYMRAEWYDLAKAWMVGSVFAAIPFGAGIGMAHEYL